MGSTPPHACTPSLSQQTNLDEKLSDLSNATKAEAERLRLKLRAEKQEREALGELVQVRSWLHVCVRVCVCVGVYVYVCWKTGEKLLIKHKICG